jgi:hypothetical protein
MIQTNALYHCELKRETGKERFPFQFTVIQGIPRKQYTRPFTLTNKVSRKSILQCTERITTYPGQDNNSCICKIDIDFLVQKYV